jgi:hypothetical protein
MNFLPKFFPFLIRAVFNGARGFPFLPPARILRTGVAGPATS